LSTTSTKNTTKLLALFILGLVVGIGGTYAALPKPSAPGAGMTVTATMTGGGLSGTITLGGAFEQTGDYAADGTEDMNAVNMAISDVNAYLQSIGSPVQFTIAIVDTKSTPEGALQAVQTLVETKGVQVILGPGTSREVASFESYINDHHVVDLPISSSPALATRDYKIRFDGPDTYQGPAMAELAMTKGCMKSAVIYRGDVYGDALFGLFKDRMTAKGGSVEGVRYTPDLPDYASEVGVLSQKVSAFGVGPATCVTIIAFETDGLNILGHARLDNTLSSVNWFGAEILKTDVLIPPKGPAEVADFMMKVHMIGVFPSATPTPTTQDFVNRYKAKYGVEPIGFGFQEYDAAWIACLAILAVGKYDGAAVNNAIPIIATKYYGVSGYKALDANGDLLYQNYGIWAPVKDAQGNYSFKYIGLYDSSTGQFTWYTS
jgi:branched-chain amino acid transport system substrate-binding protein